MPTFHQTTSFLKYKLFEIDAYSLHSPSLYSLYQDCFRAARKLPDDPEIESIRDRMKKDETLVDIIDFGAGSKISEKTTRSIGSIVKGGISQKKHSKLFVQLIKQFDCKNVVELGTSLGINALYLAKAAPDVQVSTFEGCESMSEIATYVTTQCDCTNIRIIRGNIDDTLPSYLGKTRDIDLIFIDANHTYGATLAYIDQIISKLSFRSIMILDDIYWSREMTKIWKDMKKRFPEATFVDIFQCGIIIFDKNMPSADLRFVY